MAVTAPQMWVDGAMIASADATLPLMAHAAQRGSLVFDVGSFHETPRGAALFRAREHVARLLRSARAVGLSTTRTEEELVSAARDVVRACGRDEGLVRWSVFFAAREPDVLPRSSDARVAVAAQLYEDAVQARPLSVAVFDDARKAAPEALSPSIKAAAAYLGPMLAKRRAVAAGADEIVLLDRDGCIAEAPTANVFAVRGGVLFTPPCTYVLDGITRDAVLAIARAERIEAREEPLTPEAFAAADEAFLTATSYPIAPLTSVNGRAFRGAPGEVTRRLAARLTAAQCGTDPVDPAWIRYVQD